MKPLTIIQLYCLVYKKCVEKTANQHLKGGDLVSCLWDETGLEFRREVFYLMKQGYVNGHTLKKLESATVFLDLSVESLRAIKPKHPQKNRPEKKASILKPLDKILAFNFLTMNLGK